MGVLLSLTGDLLFKVKFLPKIVPFIGQEIVICNKTSQTRSA